MRQIIYDGHHQATNTSPTQQDDNYLDCEKSNISTNTEQEQQILLEPHQQGTGNDQLTLSHCHNQLQNDQDQLATIPEEDEEIDPADQDTLVFKSEESDEE